MPVVHVVWGAETNVETFGTYATGGPPEGWTEAWGGGGAWEVVTDSGSAGGQSLQHTATSSDRFALTWDAAGTPTDVEVLALFSTNHDSVVASNDDHQNRLYLRVQGSDGSETALYAELKTTQEFSLKYYEAGSSITVSEPAFSWSANDRVAARFRASASTVQGKAWIPGDPGNATADEPASWMFSETITAVTGGGGVGVGGFSYRGTRTFEWVSFATGGDTAQAPS